MNRPVILLAFANDRRPGADYLRNLPQELFHLKKVLEEAEDKGLCELVILTNASIDQIVDTFQKEKYRDRIAIFHFAGHANSYELLLEEFNGNTRFAKADGFVPFLAGQNGLKLVFLNGCLTSMQAIRLKEEGIPAVVGTIAAVNDQLATNLAIAFYSGLSKGLPIDRSWREAVFQQQAKTGNQKLEDFYWQPLSDFGANNRGLDIDLEGKFDRFPWELFYREGAEKVRLWNLPDAVEDPYFGLPQIPDFYEYPYPPYKFLKRYTSEDARIFFGRGRYIRDLYHRINDPGGAPIILLFGQSGVGKSSLLSAGLVPRLEKDFDIKYLRRSSEIGLSGDLLNVLGLKSTEIQFNSSSSSDIRRDLKQLQDALKDLDGMARKKMEEVIEELTLSQGNHQSAPFEQKNSLLESWKEYEKTSGKGLIVILDQVEEVFTRPIANMPDELNQLLDFIHEIFSSPLNRPKGKIILGYRKEFDSEIEDCFRSYSLPVEKVYLDRLNKKDIIEVVRGLNFTPQLTKQYRLEVESGLPLLIANNLLEDRESPLAPVLQIILAKLWQKNQEIHQRKFSIADYFLLKEEGILLQDFYDQQMMKIRQWEGQLKESVESSGLVLDVLNYHLTKLGTAESRSLEDIRIHYQHKEDIIEKLIKKLQNLYLLTDPDTNWTRLAHDTLAPIVQKEVRQSDRPGQRALRILENKHFEYLHSPGKIYLDSEDLKLVEKGTSGMRVWLPAEQEIVKISQRRRRQRRFMSKAGIFLGIMVLVFASLFSLNKIELNKKKQISSLQNQATLFENAGQPNKAFATIQKAFEIDHDDLGTIITRNEIYSSNEFYKNSYLMEDIAEKVCFSPDGNTFVTIMGANAVLMDTAGTILQGFNSEGKITDFTISPDGKLLLAATEFGKIWMWKITGQKLFNFSGHGDSAIRSITFFPSGEEFITGDDNGIVKIWDSRGNQTGQMSGVHQGAVLAVSSSSDRKFHVTGGQDGKVALWTNDGQLSHVFKAHSDKVLDLTFSPDNKSIISAGRDNMICIWNLDGQIIRQINAHQKRVNAIISFFGSEQFEAKEQWRILSCSDDGSIKLWDKLGNELSTFRGHNGYVFDISCSPKNNLLLSTGEDKLVRLWNIESKTHKLFGNHMQGITDLDISKDGQYLFTSAGSGNLDLGMQLPNASMDFNLDFLFPGEEPGEAFIWSIRNTEIKTAFSGHEGGINTISFDDERHRILTGGADGILKFWDKDGKEIKQISGHKGGVLDIAIDPANGHFLTTGVDSMAILWDSDGQKLHNFPRQNGWLTSVDYSSRLEKIITAGYEGKLCIWRSSGELLKEINAHFGRIEDCVFSSDGKYILTGGWDNTARLWSSEGDSLLTVLITDKNKTGGQAVNCVVFSPDNKFFLLGAEGGIAKIFDLSGRLIQTIHISGGSGIHGASFSSDGKRFYLGSSDGYLREYLFIGVTQKFPWQFE